MACGLDFLANALGAIPSFTANWTLSVVIPNQFIHSVFVNDLLVACSDNSCFVVLRTNKLQALNSIVSQISVQFSNLLLKLALKIFNIIIIELYFHTIMF